MRTYHLYQLFIRKCDIMNSEPLSLMHPANSDCSYHTLTPESQNDLSVDFICEALSKDPFEQNLIREILIKIPDSTQVVNYRCAVFEDFLRFPKLREDMTAVLAKLKDLRDIERFQKDSEASSLWQLVNRLREIDEYVDCITAIKTTLETIDIKSEGLIALRNQTAQIFESSSFPMLKKDIEEALTDIKKVKSITLGVNLDDMLRPKTVGVVSLNNKHFTDSGLLKRVLKITGKEELHEGTDVSGINTFHPANPSTSNLGFGTAVTGAQKDIHHIENSSLTGTDPMSDALKRVVTDILKRTVTNLKSMLNKYVGVSGYAFLTLMPEIVFYIRFAELCDKIKAKGLPLCRAHATDISNRNFFAKKIYNFKLAIRAAEGADGEIVTNDFAFDDNARIYILTGPNRGGKTTITQAVGLAFLLAQSGIYVPASSMTFSPCDNIFTHFPADENDTVDLGRLGEESKRLSEIFELATKYSLILMNESFATTNVSEGMYIAKDVVKAMRYLGVRCVFNTHMHDLARNLDDLNRNIEGDSRVESMVTGVENGNRSFKIFIAPPQGISYAKDIALKYGVTYEIIKEKLDSKAE